MGPLMTPNTELFYAFINLDDTPVPCDLPEEDVFSRAFKQGTIFQPDSKKNDFNSFLEQESPQDSPQDLVFDDFPSKDSNDSGDTSPSSDGTSSVRPTFNTPKYNTTSDQAVTRNDCPNVGPLDTSGAVTSRFNSYTPRQEMSDYPVETIERLQFSGPTIPNNLPFLSQNYTLEPQPPKPPPRRRNTKRKLRTEEEEAAKRKAFLERNRMAAQKCRSRKKRQTNTLEDDLAIQQEINARLKEEVRDLTAELGKLKEVYLQCEQECRQARLREGASEAVPSPVQNIQKEETVEAMDVS